MGLSPEMADLLKKVNETHEQIGTLLEGLNEAPNSAVVPDTAKGVGDGLGDDQIGQAIRSRLQTQDELDTIRASLKGRTEQEIVALFAKQAVRKDTGVPLPIWLWSGGQALSERFPQMAAQLDASTQVEFQKALDSGTASALIRQDLEPMLYELFVRRFPLFDRIDRIPANGLVHAYNQMTSYGDADWIGELDTVTDDRGTYVRQITNVGILATRRGVSLKSQFATLQGGAGFNPERLELRAGMTAMASRYQKTILMGNWSDNTGTLNNELGPYDDDSFDGLRKILNTASAINVDPATNPDTTGSIRRAVDAAVLPITEAGGSPSIVIGAPSELVTFDEQQDDKIRIVRTDGGNVTVGVRANAVETLNGALPFFNVPGGQISSYVATGTYSGNTVRDLYVLDESALAIPYLGSASPTVLEIPIGVSGQLTHLFIIFFMGGLAVQAPTWSNKIRVKVA